MDDAADAGGEEAQGRDGQAEALAAHEAVLGLIDVAVVHGLAGALAVAEGQQHARRREEVLHHQHRGDQGDGKAQHALDQVVGHGGDAGVEDLPRALFGELAAGAFEGGGHKAQPQHVIGEQLHMLDAPAVKEGGLEDLHPGNEPHRLGDEQQQGARQHRGGDQGRLQEAEGPLQGVGGEQAHQQQRNHVEKAPYVRVPKICHQDPPWRYFCCARRSVHISAR